MDRLLIRGVSLAAALLLLAGCGGSQLPIGAPGSMSQSRVITRQRPSAAAFTTARSRVRPVYSVLHSFGGSQDGSNPVAALINVKGALYGTTENAAHGECNFDACGTAFAISTSGKETILYTFFPEVDGASPRGGLANIKGTLYGTGYQAGANGLGTVIAITAPGAETTLCSFRGQHPDGEGARAGIGDGAYPEASLIDVKGTLYGTTRRGGAYGHGAVFKVTTSGAESVIHSFGAWRDGYYPAAGLVDLNGTLYGTTTEGGKDGLGTVFAVSMSGAESVLYSFRGGHRDGATPEGTLANVRGTLYGTTANAGQHNSGAVFAITPSGAETLLHSFRVRSADGAEPEAGLINVKGSLYGTTYQGGANDVGTVFKVTTSGRETVLHSFERSSDVVSADGKFPRAALVDVEGTLYGTTSAGGVYGKGTVFSLKP